MEILKHGKTYAEIECADCEAIVGYSYRDIEHKTMHDAVNGVVHETSTEFIYCPECGCRLVLSLKIDGVSREVRGNN